MATSAALTAADQARLADIEFEVGCELSASGVVRIKDARLYLDGRAPHAVVAGGDGELDLRVLDDTGTWALRVRSVQGPRSEKERELIGEHVDVSLGAAIINVRTATSQTPSGSRSRCCWALNGNSGWRSRRPTGHL